MREMKDSGYKWLGSVSKKVTLMPLKYILSEEKNPIKVGPFGSQLSGSDLLDEESDYWVYNQRIVLDNNYATGDAFIDQEKYDTMQGFHVKSNDILITTRGTIGKISRIPENHKKGILHPCIIRFRINEEKYNYNLLQIIFNCSDLISRQINYKSNATTIDVIYSDTLRNIILPVWNIHQQAKIAVFLDKKCAEIDALSADIQAQIDTLEQYKRSVITEAVTKGLNPNVEMKDSGIQWIGNIPISWSLIPVKYCFEIGNGSDPITSEGSTPVYGSGSSSFKTCEEFKVGPTVLLGRKGTINIPQWIEGNYWNVDTAFNTTPKGNYNLRLFYYAACCFDYDNYSTQTALPSMTQFNYNNFRLPYPDIEEQNKIVTYLDKKYKEINEIISMKNEQLCVLESLKKSLIYEYVTGKKEVLEQ